jgi:hypothetical protein
VDLREAAELLGTSTEAVRKRAARGSLRSDRQDGRVLVWVDEGRTEGGREAEVDREALLEAKDQAIRILEEQLEAERRANEENRRLLAALIQRVPELEAPQEPPGGPETAAGPPDRGDVPPATGGAQEGAKRPWWRKLFGG